MENGKKIATETAPGKGGTYLTLHVGRGTEVRVTKSPFRGRERIDLRVFVEYKNGGSGPTRKGVNLPITDLPRLRDALQRAEADAWREGLLDEFSDYGDHGLEPPAT